MASSSSSSSGCWKYDVFLSFRGEDTRKTFVDHLYHALDQRAIRTYKDDVTLARGDTIGPALFSAIQESHIALIIFSANYADSSWCLDELSYIMKCKEERGQIVMPIFYHVDPFVVRKQKGEFGKAFAKHERLENSKNKVDSWKNSLFDASNIAGWEPKHVTDGHEAKCIQEIVGSILVKLSSLDSTVEDEDLVGMGTRLKQLKSQLRIESHGVRMAGIWGLGGGGKTTLATSIYTELSADFDGCCFLGDIREESRQHGLRSLQEKVLLSVFHTKIEVQSVELGKKKLKEMLYRRKVLIVLDDVDHPDQLKALAGSREWFGDGSRIIITTRDRHLLTTHRVDDISPISLLSRDEAIRLFRRHAYCEDKPLQDYEMLSQQVVSYAAGLPLALIVLGSFLYDKDNDEWIGTLSRLKDHPEMDIVEKLKISYDGLKHVEKELFLDIACFYRQKSKDNAMKILDACGFHPGIGIKVLKQKALINVSSDGKFDMHDLVQEMAHYIVRGEHPNNPEKHSRIWREEDIEDMCSRNATTENDKIEAITAYGFFSSDFIMLVSNMKKLRFLVKKTKKRFLVVRDKDTYDEGPSFLSNELRYIRWNSYPASPFPESFQPRKLHVLRMSLSLQKVLWKGCKYLPCLKELELRWMEALVRTPDFGGLPCLQKLILHECPSLEEIHESLGNHLSLVSVEVRYCKKLRRFPSIVRMKKLEMLRISVCEALVEFPKIEAKMDNLAELELGWVGIEVLPLSVGEYCTNLISLKLSRCGKLKSIEGNFQALRKLNLSGCGLKDGEIPTQIGEFFSLQELCLSQNDFTRLDFSLSRLTRLKLLCLNNCKNLVRLDFSLSRLASLKILDVHFCDNLVELPELPSSLAILEADDCQSLEVISDEVLTNCKWLCKVSIVGVKNVIGGERLLETVLQGNVVESRCLSLRVQGLEIARGFVPGLVKGGRCGMQLPDNWFNHFSGFLICAATSFYFIGETMEIIMKHEEEVSVDDDDSTAKSVDDDGSSGHPCVGRDDGRDESDDNDDDGIDESVDDGRDESVDDDVYGCRNTWVGYIPFSLLKDTLWWDPTSTAIHMKMYNIIGLKLVPKRGGEERSGSAQMETTTHSSSSSSEFSLDDDDHYKCKFEIQHDSKSDLKCRIDYISPHFDPM